MSTDYAPRHLFRGVIKAGGLHARIQRVKEQRALYLYVYPPSIHSAEDDAPGYMDFNAGIMMRRKIELRVLELRNERGEFIEGFVAPLPEA